jgi:hypothetical protein
MDQINKEDTINRQAAIDAIQDEVEPFAIVEPGTTYVVGAGVKDADVIKVLEELPSAEPAIITCNQCVHYQQNHHYCEFLDTEFSPSDYCSMAEREDDV